MESHSVAKNLIYQRKLKGFSQEELSNKSNITIRTIQRIEKEEVTPHLQTIKLLAAALEIEIDDLLVLENPKEETILKKWLLLLHGTPILGLVIPLCNVLLPLFLWIHKREDNKIYDEHGRKIVNFQITMTILFFFSLVALITIEKYGVLFFLAVIPFTIIVGVINIISAINSQKCYYPLSLPFLKKKRNINKLGLLLIVPFLCLGCNKASTKTISRLDSTIISKDSLNEKIIQLVNDANVHGIAVTIFNKNEIVFKKTFGYKDYQTKEILSDSTNIYGASFSKAIFSVLVMKLVEEKVIDLDTPLESYLPRRIYEYEPLTKWHDDFSSLKNDSLYHKITARMCLSHTTGLPNWRWFEPDHKLKVHFEPGTRYSYSGEGMVYLQVVLERLLGKGIEDLAREIIFEPLGMKNSSYQWQPRFENDFAYGHNKIGELYTKDTDNEPRAPSTLETTAEDYSKFLKAVLEEQIVTESTSEELFSPQVKIRSLRQFGPLALKDSTLNDAVELSYGLGWGLLKTPHGIGAFKEGHGNGFQHYSIIFPKAGKGMMIMTNSDNGESIFKELLETGIKDIYTPWEWQNYIPYNLEVK